MLQTRSFYWKWGHDDYVTVPFSPQGTGCAFACADQTCIARQSRSGKCLCGCAGRFFQDGNYAWRREDHGQCKGIQEKPTLKMR